MYRIAMLEKRSWVIVDRRYVFVLLKEKLLSAFTTHSYCHGYLIALNDSMKALLDLCKMMIHFVQ